MSRSASLGMALLFLLTAFIAASWGAHNLGLTDSAPVASRADIPASADATCAYVPGRLYSLPSAAEVAVSRAAFAAAHICYYTPGQMFAPPSAADIAQARAGWAWTGLCLYDPSRDFGAFPTAADLAQTRALLWGSSSWAAGFASLMAAIGAMSIGHGLLVNSLSIFNPAFVSIGWWLLLPELALLQAGWAGAAGIGASALSFLAPRYVRRRQSIDAMRRAPRGWLTPKRVALVGGGWMMTVGVLAGVYPNIANLIPQIPGITAPSNPMPRIGGGSAGRADGGSAPAAPNAPTASSDPIPSAGGMPPLPPGAAGGEGGQGQPQAPSQSPSTTPPGVGPSFAGLSGGSGTTGGGSPDGATPSADGGGTTGGTQGGPSTLPAIPTTSIGAIDTYLPPSLPAPAPSPSTTAPNPSPAAPDPSKPDVPATPLPPVQTLPGEDARPIIADTPIIDPNAPLPSSPDAVLPVDPPAPSPGGGGTPPVTPEQPGTQPEPTGPLAPANPGAIDGGTDPLPVPEPAMIGLFALGALALTRRRAK